MATPITIPDTAYIIPVNLSSSWKTFTLPVVSTNVGRTLIFKDMFGNATNSTIRLSTIGLDRIDAANASVMILSNAYGAWTFGNDGIRSWFLMDVYQNNLLTVGPAVASLNPIPALRYSFLSGNYSGVSPVANIGSNSALGSGTVVASSYTSANPGFISTGANTNHYVQAPSQSGIQTIIMIVRVSSGNGNSYLLDARTGLGNGWMWSGGTGGDWTGQTYYRDCVLTSVPTNIPGSLQDNTWHHVCFIRPAFTDDVTYLARFSLNESILADTAEIMAFTQALTLQQVKDNFNFFASRFGWAPVA